MADIISGKSRFNGDRNAPVKKVISINREMAASTEDNEDVLDEATVKRKIRRHKSRVAVVVTIIIIVILAAVYIVSRVIDNYDYSSYENNQFGKSRGYRIFEIYSICRWICKI